MLLFLAYAYMLLSEVVVSVNFVLYEYKTQSTRLTVFHYGLFSVHEGHFTL